MQNCHFLFTTCKVNVLVFFKVGYTVIFQMITHTLFQIGWYKALSKKSVWLVKDNFNICKMRLEFIFYQEKQNIYLLDLFLHHCQHILVFSVVYCDRIYFGKNSFFLMVMMQFRKKHLNISSKITPWFDN